LRLILVAAVALVAGLGAAVAAIALVGGEESPHPGPSESVRDEPVSGPPVTLSGTDVRTGEAIALRRLADRPVVIAVWASWCGACVRQADAFERFVSSHAQVSVLAVDTQEDAAAAQAFLESTGLELPTVADTEGQLAARLGVRELPTTLFLAQDHRVASMWEGTAGLADLNAGLQIARRG
jgi:thiol-disulfide isomerase/thioredoxin